MHRGYRQWLRYMCEWTMCCSFHEMVLYYKQIIHIAVTLRSNFLQLVTLFANSPCYASLATDY